MLIHSDTLKDEDSENKEICLVCHEPIENTDTVKLRCGHKFHYNCILMTFKYSKVPRQCPYCRGYGGYLELKEGMLPLVGIHKEYKDLIDGKLKNIKLIEGKCKKLLKTGKNKGCQCKNKPKPNEEYCGVHL